MWNLGITHHYNVDELSSLESRSSSGHKAHPCHNCNGGKRCCHQCTGDGVATCSSCKGNGHVKVYIRLTVKW